VTGLHSPDGDDLGEATYAMMIMPDEEILLGAGKPFRRPRCRPFEDAEASAARGKPHCGC